MIKKDVFDLYKMIKVLIHKHEHELKKLINKEYKDIQYIKTTSMNENYMFNDSISNNFYKTIGLTKDQLKQLISQYVTITNNYDSLDANNILLLFLIRYGLENNDHMFTLATYEIFAYKLYYPIFNTYFPHGVDENAFAYFKSSIGDRSDLTKFDTIYGVIDKLAHGAFNTYKKDIMGKSDKHFLLLPVHLKTRYNQSLKGIMQKYTPFIANNKVYLNSSRELESKDEDDESYTDQNRNNNNAYYEQKNKLAFALIHRDIPHIYIESLKHKFQKISGPEIYEIYGKIIKNKDIADSLSSAYIEYGPSNNIEVDSIKFYNEWFNQVGSYQSNLQQEVLDKFIINHLSDVNINNKKEMVERRRIILTMLYLLIKQANKV